MAITHIGLLSASRLRLKYRATADTDGGSGIVDNATLVANALPGPLQALLAGTYADLAALLIATTNSPSVSLYAAATTAVPVAIGVELGLASNKAILVIAVGAASSGTAMNIELVYNHTIVR